MGEDNPTTGCSDYRVKYLCPSPRRFERYDGRCRAPAADGEVVTIALGVTVKPEGPKFTRLLRRSVLTTAAERSDNCRAICKDNSRCTAADYRVEDSRCRLFTGGQCSPGWVGLVLIVSVY